MWWNAYVVKGQKDCCRTDIIEDSKVKVKKYKRAASREKEK